MTDCAYGLDTEKLYIPPKEAAEIGKKYTEISPKSSKIEQNRPKNNQNQKKTDKIDR